MKRKVDPKTGEILEGELVAASEGERGEEQVIATLPCSTAEIKIAPGMDAAIQSLGDEAIRLSMYASNLTVTNLEEEKRATNDLVMCRDIFKQCGAGINLATFQWCLNEKREEYHLLMFSFNVKDCVCPVASDGKFRVSKCIKIGECDWKGNLIPKEETGGKGKRQARQAQ